MVSGIKIFTSFSEERLGKLRMIKMASYSIFCNVNIQDEHL